MKKSTFHAIERSKTIMFRLNNETQIPEIGLGVYKMEAGKEMNDAVKYAYQSGYRLYDTAQMYKNEQALGDALKENKIPREDIFLISKVNNCNQGYEKTISSFKESLQKLQTEYLDAFLVHWPGQQDKTKLECLIHGKQWNIYTKKAR